MSIASSSTMVSVHLGQLRVSQAFYAERGPPRELERVNAWLATHGE